MGIKCQFKISRGSQTLKEVCCERLNDDISSVVKNLKYLKTENERFLGKLVEVEKANAKKTTTAVEKKSHDDNSNDSFDDDEDDIEDENFKPTEAKKPKRE